MNARDALKLSALFKDFTDTGLIIVGNICHPKTFPQGTPIFAENMVAESLLVIGEGRVALSSKGKDGAEVSLGELGPGDWMGELSLITTGQRLCTATAASAVTAFEIRQSDFQQLMATKPQACMKLLMGIVTQFGQKVTDNKDSLKSLLGKS